MAPATLPAVRAGLLALCFSVISTLPTGAQVWTDWTATMPGTVGSAQGYMPLPGGDVGVAYEGQVLSTGTFSFTFARPVRDLFLAMVSVGRVSVPVGYTFSSPFTLIDEGRGPWGDGSFAVLPGNVLEGREGHRVVHFPGVHSRLEWTVTNPEHWHGFTVGALPTTTAPEPGTMFLLGSGLVGIVVAARRRRRQQG